MKVGNYNLKKSKIARAVWFSAACCAAIICGGAAQAQTGGDYAVTQSVIAAGGGQNSTGGTFVLDGTVGQATVGQTLTGATYTLNPGFWTPNNLAPTAAGVTLGGRVMTAEGAGIRNALVTLTSTNGATRTVITRKFGFYSFADVAAGEIYIVSVTAKRFRFAQNAQVHSAIADDTNINFVADFNPSSQLPLETAIPN